MLRRIKRMGNTLETKEAYTEWHTALALAKYISGIDTVKTHIGEFGSSHYDSGVKDMVVSGHQIFDMGENPVYVYTSMDTVIDARVKFGRVNGKSTTQLINSLVKQGAINGETGDEIIEKIKDINTNRQVIVPFKPHTDCRVTYEIGNTVKKDCGATIKFVKWFSNKETMQLDCKLGFELKETATEKTIIHDITDYMHGFKANAVMLHANDSKKNDEMIKVTNQCIIEPVEVTDGRTTAAIDGTFMYLKTGDTMEIVGHWNPNNEFVFTEKKSTKTVKFLKDNINIIAVHRKYIAPYMLYEANHFEI